ncbi:MAG: T9SS type A sorting domain-containing protein [Candidatus Marinimicrobia bacterium]|nr:T9SS type A sorting domain-containing protein [Candidatus Neomarinimicrobiota bacterium]
MKRNCRLKALNWWAPLLLALPFSLNAQATVEIITSDPEITVRDSVQLVAVYTDNAGQEIDTTFNWAVAPDKLGTIDATGLFISKHMGDGLISASLGALADTTTISVLKHDPDKGDPGTLLITPTDTTVLVGDSVQFAACYQDTTGAIFDTVVTWSLHGDKIGTLSDAGLLLIDASGSGLVTASLGKLEASSLTVAVDSLEDNGGVNTIYILRVLPDGKEVGPKKQISEGDQYVMGGLPRPLNVLNASRLYFPDGCLHQDITIKLMLPDFVKIKGDTAVFDSSIFAGLKVDVLVADTLVQPFYFDIPISIAVVFKRGLLKNLGIEPEELGLFFALDSANFDIAGIYDVTVDTTSNRIFSRVAHFSTLVVRKASTALSINTGGRHSSQLPGGFALEQNYPNPFNPATTLAYNLPRTAEITLIVYDLIGREVVRLKEGPQTAGHYRTVWRGRDSAGREMPSGIYFARLEAGEFSQSIKLVLLK